jgi:hypothetical protein
MVFSDTGKNIGCLITVSKCGAVRFDDEIFRHDQHGDGGKRDCKAFGDAEPGRKDRLNIAPGVCRRSSERMPECHLSHWQSHVTPLRDPLPFSGSPGGLNFWASGSLATVALPGEQANARRTGSVNAVWANAGQLGIGSRALVDRRAIRCLLQPRREDRRR